MSNPLAESTGKMLDVLTPLTSEERLRVVNAALVLLGDAAFAPRGTASTGNPGNGASDVEDGQDQAAFPPAAKVWLRKNGIKTEQLEQFLHFDNGKVQATALWGGASKKSEQTQHAYLLAGLVSLLENGEPSFSDQEARKLCQHFGCYDQANHAKIVGGLGNRITGSKSSGWKLTAPGLNACAELAKQAAV